MKSVNDKLTLFLFQEEALIYSQTSEAVHWLNALGIFIWLQLEEGLNQQQVKTKALDNGCKDSFELDTLIAELFSLLSTGLIKKNNHKQEQKKEQTQEEWLTKIKFTSQTLVKVSDEDHGLYRILDSYFTFSFPNPKVAQLIKPFLAQFRVEEEKHLNTTQAELIHLKIISEADQHYQLVINDYRFSWLIPEKRLLSFLLDRLRKMAFHFSEYYLAAHAATLAKGKYCFMFPATSYSGKSTLSAALFASGYRYLSDEMTILDEKFQARPVPLGLGLKEGSWSLLQNRFPGIVDTPELERWDGITIKYLPITYSKGMHEAELKGVELSQERVKVSHLIFPHYKQDASASLEKISVPQALIALYQAGYAQAGNLSEDKLENLLENLSTVPAYHFVFDKLDEAVNCLESLS